MDKVLVIFKKPWAAYSPKDVAGFDEKTAQALITSKAADLYVLPGSAITPSVTADGGGALDGSALQETDAATSGSETTDSTEGGDGGGGGDDTASPDATAGGTAAVKRGGKPKGQGN